MKRMALLFVTLVVVVAGCGADATIESATIDSAAKVDNQTSLQSSTTPIAVGSSAGNSDRAVDDSSNTTTGDWCVAAQMLEDSFPDFDVIDVTDPVAIEQAFDEALAFLTQAEAIAPPPISADISELLHGYTLFRSAMEAAEWSFEKVDLSAVNAIGAEQQAAVLHIENYNAEECGVE